MATVTVVFLLLLCLTYLESRNILKNGMLIAFCFVGLFFSFRYDYGNDYSNYLRIFDDISEYDSIKECLDSREIGWTLLNYIFKWGGYQFILFLHSAILLIIYYGLIRKYIPKKYWWLGVFILFFNPIFFLLDLSMLRQSLAITLFVKAIDYSLDKKIIYASIVSLIGVSFHFSAIVGIPFIFLVRYIPLLKPKYVVGGMVLLLIALSMIPDIVDKVAFLISENESISEKYGNYHTEGKLGSGMGVMLQYMFLLPIVSRKEKTGNVNVVLICLYLVSFMFIPLSEKMVLYGRLSAYFNIFSIILVPRLLYICKSVYIKYFTLLCVLFYIIYSYVTFFYSETYGYAYITYQSVLSLPQ